MSFDTVTFWIFFALAWTVWRFAPFVAAKRATLFLSLVFYAWWSPWYVPLIVTSAVVDYVAGGRIHAAAERGTKRRWLFLSLFANVGLLSIFKYGPFAVENASFFARTLGFEGGWELVGWVVPIGISFYTFQTLSYSFDIYLGRLTPAKSFWDFFLFVAFFPQLVMGPIVRARELLPQFRRRRRLLAPAVQTGLYMITCSLFLKVVVADNVAHPVNRVFDAQALPELDPLSVWLGAFYFSIQAFADFAGYSGIAIGVAYLLGLRFPENFRYPYISQSFTEMWTRWHKTLSYWFRDYIYVPLGGNRRGMVRFYVAIMATFLISGLWHGAAWTYVSFGAIHGIGIAVERTIGGAKRSEVGTRPANALALARRLVRIAFTHALWVVSVVFFRAEDFPMAWAMLERMFVAPFTESFELGEVTNARYLLLVAPVLAMHAGQLLHEWYGLKKHVWLRATVAGVFLFLLLVVRRSEAGDFIYFQF